MMFNLHIIKQKSHSKTDRQFWKRWTRYLLQGMEQILSPIICKDQSDNRARQPTKERHVQTKMSSVEDLKRQKNNITDSRICMELQSELMVCGMELSENYCLQ